MNSIEILLVVAVILISVKVHFLEKYTRSNYTAIKRIQVEEWKRKRRD